MIPQSTGWWDAQPASIYVFVTDNNMIYDMIWYDMIWYDMIWYIC
jgi:hypothetical protein